MDGYQPGSTNQPLGRWPDYSSQPAARTSTASTPDWEAVKQSLTSQLEVAHQIEQAREKDYAAANTEFQKRRIIPLGGLVIRVALTLTVTGFVTWQAYEQTQIDTVAFYVGFGSVLFGLQFFMGLVALWMSADKGEERPAERHFIFLLPTLIVAAFALGAGFPPKFADYLRSLNGLDPIHCAVCPYK